jgi:hypothetical protein
VNQYHVPDQGGSTKFGWLADTFIMDEFEGALDRYNNSAPGLDGIRLIMFKLLLEEAGIFYEIMKTGRIIGSWLTTKVVPILKPRKHPELLDSYRPILPCVRKLLEKMLGMLGWKNMTFCRLASMVFEKARRRGIVWRCLQRMSRPLLKGNSTWWQHILIYWRRMTTS